MSDLLDEKCAVQPDILYLHSHDGKPLRELYPTWSANYKQEFTVYAKEYMHGAGESEKNCFEELRQVVRTETVDKFLEAGALQEDVICRKLQAVIDGLWPISVHVPYINEKKGEEVKDREIIAYGIYGALNCGMRLDFAPIIAKCRAIQVGVLAGGAEKERALRELDRLLLEIRQMNFLGSVLEACADLSATCTNALRGVALQDTELEKLPDHVKKIIAKMHARFLDGKLQKIVTICNGAAGNPFRRLVLIVNKFTLQYLAKVNGVIQGALKKIRAGKFYKPRDDGSGFYAVSLLEPIADIVDFVNGLTGREKVKKVEKDMAKWIQNSFKRLGKWMLLGINEREAKKIIATYEKKGKIPVGMTEEFVRQLADEYRAFTYKG